MGTIQIDGSTPKLTIGNATAEDALIVFDGNAQDFHIGLDDTADDLVIGVGSALGTTTALAIDENAGSTFSGTVTVGVDDTGKDVKFFGATSGKYWLWDESADGVVQIGTHTVGVDDAGHDVKFFGATASRYWLWDESADGVVQRGTLTVGVDDTGHDVKLFGATSGSYALWDESADDLNLIASGLGVVSAKDLGAGIHIRIADSGASASSASDALVIENSTHEGISILTSTSTIGEISFGDSGDNDIGRLRYNHSTDAMEMYTSAALGLKIDSTGAVTKPLQPAFLVRPASEQSDIALSSAITVVFGTEVYDINGDFASNTFTAPIAGKYHLETSIILQNIDSAANSYLIEIQTSNRMYRNIIDPDFGQDNAYLALTLSALADMDASDTAIVEVYQGAGTQQTDVSADSHFSGHLAC